MHIMLYQYTVTSTKQAYLLALWQATDYQLLSWPDWNHGHAGSYEGTLILLLFQSSR